MDLTSIDQWDLAAMEESLAARARTLADVESELIGIAVLPGWEGTASDAARDAYGAARAELTREAAVIGATSAVTRQTADAVTHLKGQLDILRADAALNVMTIVPSGAVLDIAWTILSTDPTAVTAREVIRTRLHDGAHALIMEAIDIDSDAALVFTTINADGVASSGAVDVASGIDVGTRQGALSAPFPPTGATPTQVDAYWDAMPDAQRAEMISTHPSSIGNLDGIPSTARSEANINQLPTERARLESMALGLQSKLDGQRTGGWLSNDDAGLKSVRNKIHDIDEIERTLRDNPDALLTVFDMNSHENGLAAVAIGNPDTADHITVTTPGLNTTVGGSLNAMTGEAQDLNDEMKTQLVRAGRDGETVANIAWIGYQPPQFGGPGALDAVPRGLEVATDVVAKEAAPVLASYYEGLDAASQTADPHVSAFGHSYGSLTTSEALQAGGSAVVDDAVVYGSPGVNAVGPSDMGMPYQHVWAMDADGDPVTASGHAGPLSPFGAGPYNHNYQQLSSEGGMTPDGIMRDGSSGHSDYARLGENGELRTAGYNLAVIGIGRPDLVVH